MKRVISVAIAVVMLLTFTCAAYAELAGGWSVTEDTAITEEAQTAFDAALEGFVGSDVEPVALLGTQVVAGVNYCFLVRVTPVVPDATAHYAYAYVYAGVDGTASLLEITDIELGVN